MAVVDHSATFRFEMNRRALLVDSAVAMAGFALSVAMARGAPFDPDARQLNLLAYALLGLYSGAIVLRDRWPRVAVAVGVASGLAYAAASFPEALTPVLLPAFYTAAIRLAPGPGRRLIVASVVASAIGATLGPGSTTVSPPILVAGAWLLGRSVGSRQRYTAELEAKNRELEQARHDLAEQAVTEERLRIARDLHDVVVHSMSVVAVHAGSGRLVADRDPAAAARSLQTIETTIRSALDEMRRLLGVLRPGHNGEAAAMAPAPGLEDLGALVADVVASGVRVEVGISGERPEIPAGLDLSAYRIVQEALTNVIRHAGPSAVALVEVRYTPEEVMVVVVDDGRGPTPPSRGSTVGGRPPGGYGLAGMRERVAVHGGRLEIGRGPGGGFRVAAYLPLEPR